VHEDSKASQWPVPEETRENASKVPRGWRAFVRKVPPASAIEQPGRRRSELSPPCPLAVHQRTRCPPPRTSFLLRGSGRIPRPAARRFWWGLGLTLPVFLATMAEHLPGLHGFSLPAWLQMLLVAPVFRRGTAASQRLAVGAAAALQHVHPDRPGRARGLAFQHRGHWRPGLCPMPWPMATWPSSFESAAVITVLLHWPSAGSARDRSHGQGLEYAHAADARKPCSAWSTKTRRLDRVLPGDLLRVKPAARVPVDGIVVVEGSSFARVDPCSRANRCPGERQGQRRDRRHDEWRGCLRHAC